MKDKKNFRPIIPTDRLAYFAVSHVGLKRDRNEDAYMVFDSRPISPDRCSLYLFGVADGMGGLPCGERASSIACRDLETFIADWNGCFTADQFVARLKNLLFSTDSLIRNLSSTDADCEDMGTTLSALMITEDFGLITHVGDSRIYRLRLGCLQSLTTDHTFVQEMIDEGELSPESVLHHPLRNVLTRVLGTREPLEKSDTAVIEIEKEDRFLLSTDGLHDLVSFEAIKETMAECDTPQKSAEQLLNIALQRGGKDNVTAIVVHV